MEEVYNFLYKNLNLEQKEAIVVAVSYGPDSMALLHVLKNHYKNNKIICAHIHHNHRIESDTEAKELETYCFENNIIFEMMKIEKYTNNKFTEEEARSIRYDFFDKIIKKYNAKYLFTAHHGDDLIETILMRLTRGSSLNGYAGIKLISDFNSYKIIRPFLFLTKKDILNYCNINKINYAVDKTNLDKEYTRNRYRLNILPVLKQENKDVHLKFLKFSNLIQEYQSHISKEVDSVYNNCIKSNKIQIDKLIINDNIIIRQVIEKYLFSFYKEDINKITDVNVDNIISVLKSNKSNNRVSLPLNKIIIKSYNYLYFDNDNNYNSYCFIFDSYIELPNNMIIKRIDKLENTSNYITAFDSNDISFPIYVRNKVNGDKIDVLGMNGMKKVKDVFIDEKVPINERNNYPIIVDSNKNILWIPGLKKSKYDKSKQGKYDIILKYCVKEANDDTTK